MGRQVLFKTVSILALYQPVSKMIEEFHKLAFKARNNNFYVQGNNIEYRGSLKGKYVE